MSTIEGQALAERFPRAITSGVTWLAACLEIPTFQEGLNLHSYHSVWHLQGSAASLLVDSGHPKDWLKLERQMDQLLQKGAQSPTYLFPTHAEVAHSGNIGRWLHKFPDAIVCGDVRDYHLAYPAYEHRFQQAKHGDTIDLGDTRVVLLEAIFRDHPTTMWAYDPSRRMMFTADGFAYTHEHHHVGECGLTLEELSDHPLAASVALTAQHAFYWTRFGDMEPFIRRMDDLFTRDFPTDFIAPAHGCPVTDPAAAIPRFFEGLRLIPKIG